jgi:hypothetical protein
VAILLEIVCAVVLERKLLAQYCFWGFIFSGSRFGLNFFWEGFAFTEGRWALILATENFCRLRMVFRAFMLFEESGFDQALRSRRLFVLNDFFIGMYSMYVGYFSSITKF